MTRLEQVRAEVKKISEDYSVDSLPGIEPGIFDLVVALRYCGFRTMGSCEGHYAMNERIYPWIILSATNAEYPIVLRTTSQILAFEPVKKRWKTESKALKQLICRFNQRHDQHKYPRDEKICLIGQHKSGAMLAPVGAKMLDKLPRELISPMNGELILARYQHLMSRFAEFLIKDEDTKQYRGRP